jgi:hypothetical protein
MSGALFERPAELRLATTRTATLIDDAFDGEEFHTRFSEKPESYPISKRWLQVGPLSSSMSPRHFCILRRQNS